MASITIRNLDDDVKTRLRVRAAEHHRSMEEEARVILREAVDAGKATPKSLAKFTRECFAPLGGVEFEIPRRGPMREPLDFSRAGPDVCNRHQRGIGAREAGAEHGATASDHRQQTDVALQRSDGIIRNCRLKHTAHHIDSEQFRKLVKCRMK